MNIMSDSKGYAAEAATDYYYPCCGGGVYAHFISETGLVEDEYLSGFQCVECGEDYGVSYKNEFDT